MKRKTCKKKPENHLFKFEVDSNGFGWFRCVICSFKFLYQPRA